MKKLNQLFSLLFFAFALFIQVNAHSNSNIPANNNSPAENDAPELLVRDLYRVHEQEEKSHQERILNAKNRTLLDKYFDKNLANLIWQDLKTGEDEVGVIDFDPFYNSQDPSIKNLSVAQGKIAGAKASVLVSFTDSGKRETITYSLVQQNGAWKIADIKYSEGSLLGYFKDAAKDTAKNDDNTSDAPDKAAEAKEGSFAGTYQVGTTTCIVKSTKSAFELKWARGTGTMLFSGEGENGLKFVSEVSGKGTDSFVFDDASLMTGKFIRADGKELPVRKVK